MRKLAIFVSSVICIALIRQAEAQQSTSATYGDWVVRCEQQGSPPQKLCDMDQLTRLKDQSNPLSRVTVTRPANNQPSQLIIQVPINVSVQAHVKITVEKDFVLDAPFERCIPTGCFAQVGLSEGAIKKLRPLTGRGAFTFKDASGHDVSIPVSINGFAAAYDALSK